MGSNNDKSTNQHKSQAVRGFNRQTIKIVEVALRSLNKNSCLARSRLDDNLGTELPNQDVKEIAFVRDTTIYDYERMHKLFIIPSMLNKTMTE